MGRKKTRRKPLATIWEVPDELWRRIEPILKDAYASGYRGFLTLEPHLRVAGHSHGETGPELFKVAADALKNLCRRNNIPLAGA